MTNRSSLYITKGITSPLRESGSSTMKQLDFYYYRLSHMYYYGFLSYDFTIYSGIPKWNFIKSDNDVVMVDRPMIIHRSFVDRVGVKRAEQELFKSIMQKYLMLAESELMFLVIANGSINRYSESHPEHKMKAQRFWNSFNGNEE